MPCSDCSPPCTVFGKLRNLNPSLFARALCNQAPLDTSQRIELDELVSQAEKELTACDEAIFKLQEKIIAFQNQKGTLRDHISLAKSLVAPIRKCPPEILRQIFLAHGITNILGSKRVDIPGFKLMSVCSHWRSIAMATAALWNDITVSITEHDSVWHPSHLPLAEKLLKLSARSLLTVTIDSSRSAASVQEVPPILPLLCEQADRWETLSGFCPSKVIWRPLSSLQGRLTSLRTFHLSLPFQKCSICIEGASELRALTLHSIEATSTSIPWNRLVQLTITESFLSQILQSIAQMPNLLSLRVLTAKADNRAQFMLPVQSNLVCLTIGVNNATAEKGSRLLLDRLTLPRLHLLCFTGTSSHSDFKTNQDEHRWSSIQLPSLISRSSARITSVILCKIWMPTSDLISLLQIIPSLTSLSITEPPYDDSDTMKPIVTEELLLSIHCHYRHNREPLVPRLTSLVLEGCKLSAFSITTFVEVVQSRWKPLYLVDVDVACIKEVRLTVSDGLVPFPGVVHMLMVLQKRGLDVFIKDKDGDVLGKGRDGY